DYMRCGVRAVELLEEKDITIANLDRPASTGLTEAFAPGVCPGDQLNAPCELPAGDPPSGLNQTYTLQPSWEPGVPYLDPTNLSSDCPDPDGRPEWGGRLDFSA